MYVAAFGKLCAMWTSEDPTEQMQAFRRCCLYVWLAECKCILKPA